MKSNPTPASSFGRSLQGEPLARPASTATTSSPSSSKSLAAALLAHQVEKLQLELDGVNLGARRPSGKTGYHDPARPPRTTSSREREDDSSSHDHSTEPPAAQDASASSPPRGGPLILDASALVYALPTIRRWTARRNREMIVPTEVLHTLDLLKKGRSPLSQAVRAATRFLETTLSSKPARSLPQAWVGLRVSLPDEAVVDVSFQGPHNDAVKDQRWAQQVLAVVAHFRAQGPVLVISSPHPLATLSTEDLEADPFNNHLRAEGALVASLADAASISTHWVEPVANFSGEEGGRPRQEGRSRGPGRGAGSRRGGGRQPGGSGSPLLEPPFEPRPGKTSGAGGPKMVLLRRGDAPPAGPSPPAAPAVRILRRGED